MKAGIDAPNAEVSRVWIAGSGRSGTTWLSRMLTSVRGSRLIYEPLHPGHVSLPESLQPPLRDVDERPYIRPESEAAEWARFIDGLYSGRYQNRWTRYSGIKKKSLIPQVWMNSLFADKIVAKSIRSNLMLGWLSRKPNYKVVLLLRHPCATVLSQQQRNWGVNLPLLTGDKALHADFLTKHDDYLQKGLSGLSERAARWAIENSVPIQQAKNGEDIYILTYEELVDDPSGQLRLLLEFLGWQFDEEQWKRVEARIGVGFSGLNDPASNTDLLSRWTCKLSPEQIDEVLTSVHTLGVDIYNENIMPRSGAQTCFTEV